MLNDKIIWARAWQKLSFLTGTSSIWSQIASKDLHILAWLTIECQAASFLIPREANAQAVLVSSCCNIQLPCPTHSRTHCISQKLALLWTKFRNAANHMSLHCVGHLLYIQHKNTTQHCKNFGRQGAVGAVMHLTLPLLRICAWDPAEEAFFTSLSNDHGPPGSNELQKCLLSVWFQICNRNLSVWCHGSTASLLQYQSCTSWIWTAERDQEAQKWSQSTNYQHVLKRAQDRRVTEHSGPIGRN